MSVWGNFWDTVFSRGKRKGRVSTKKSSPVRAKGKRLNAVHARLEIIYGASAHYVDLTDIEYIIGRSESVELKGVKEKPQVNGSKISIPKTFVTQDLSRKHVKLTLSNKGGEIVYRIEDIGSKHGTKFGIKGKGLQKISKGERLFFLGETNGSGSSGHEVVLASSVVLHIDYDI
jgi:hypothetical protein